jgi:hypothetical protein
VTTYVRPRHLKQLGHSILFLQDLKQLGQKTWSSLSTVFYFTKPETVGSTYVKINPQTGWQTKRANNVCETICAKAFLTLHHEQPVESYVANLYVGGVL